jgi:glycine/D-amino acid oxidase-like deaminating enzyme
MKLTDYLVIGQGICGSFLTWYLRKAGLSYVVIDNNDPATSSRIAAGVINPVTGRRIVKTWMIDQLLPFARSAYKQLGEELGANLLRETAIVTQFPSAQMRNAFAERGLSETDYLELSADDHLYSDYFEYPFGHGEIRPAYLADIQALIKAWREQLAGSSSLVEEEFVASELVVNTEGITYRDIKARAVLFCDGVASSGRTFFHGLPFALNKGEALIIRAQLPVDAVFKKAITLVPLKEDLYWAGASHEWEFEDSLPTVEFREKTSRQLKHWLKVPFTIEAHVSAVRPATLERRPFVGIHPHLRSIGILNGMGTKGCSLAPFFAHQLVEHLTKNTPILPEASIQRFSRILQQSR